MEKFEKNVSAIPEIKPAIEDDVTDIMNLHQANLAENLEEKEKQKEGFVSFKFNSEMVKKVIDEKTIITSKFNGRVVGYLIYFSLDEMKNNQFFKPLINKINEFGYNNKKLNQYRVCLLAQVCIDKNYRGKGIIEQLYKTLKNKVADQYDLGFSEIILENKKSLHVHLDKMGFDDIGHYLFNGKEWVAVVYDFSK